MGQPKLSSDVVKLSARYPAAVLGNPAPIAQRFATRQSCANRLCARPSWRVGRSQKSRAQRANRPFRQKVRWPLGLAG